MLVLYYFKGGLLERGVEYEILTFKGVFIGGRHLLEYGLYKIIYCVNIGRFMLLRSSFMALTDDYA